jgi:hypothetical protein
MEIRINGNKTDITLETERTMGDLLSGVETWLQGAGFYINGLEIDGTSVLSAGIPTLFCRDLDTVQSIDITACSRADLMLEALWNTRRALTAFDDAAPEEQGRICRDWETGAAASYLIAEIPELAGMAGQTLAGVGLPVQQLQTLIDERLREIENPLRELQNMEDLVSDIARRLEDLPLDIQTGKDDRAAETVSLFSHIAGKLCRLMGLFQSPEDGGEDVKDLHTFIEEFNTALRELLAAYEAKDTVLVGDLAEYELAPRLLKRYRVIKIPAGLAALESV